MVPAIIVLLLIAPNKYTCYKCEIIIIIMIKMPKLWNDYQLINLKYNNQEGKVVTKIIIENEYIII